MRLGLALLAVVRGPWATLIERVSGGWSVACYPWDGDGCEPVIAAAGPTLLAALRAAGEQARIHQRLYLEGVEVGAAEWLREGLEGEA